MRVEGWETYPFDRATIQDIAGWLGGRPFKMNLHDTNGYRAVSHADPLLPEANAVAWLYQYRRWGDLYYRSETSQVPISVEDTRGWLRQDVQVRFPMGKLVVQAFRDWLRRKYGTITAVNTAWNTAFGSFEEIDSEKDQAINEFGHRWEYSRRDHPFHDWNPAVADLDEFRTELRVRNYRDTLDVVRKTMPDATIPYTPGERRRLRHGDPETGDAAVPPEAFAFPPGSGDNPRLPGRNQGLRTEC